jgi:hypothetical protein
MACNISKHTNGSSNFSGSLAKSGLYLSFSTIGYTGSGLVNTFENGNAAETSPILKSDIIEQF